VTQTIKADIRIMRGLEADLPVLQENQPAFTKDTKKLFIGSDEGNVQLAKKSDVDTANANIALKANQTDLDTTNVNVASNTTSLTENAKKIGNIVTPKKFGAIGGGSVDDTIAVQAAIDYCLSFTAPQVGGQSLIPILDINDVYRITSPLKIDRPANQTGFFRISASGTVGGFTTDQPITIFSTNYVGSSKSNVASGVLSNQISFEKLTFSATVSGAKAIDLKKYVRTQVNGCFFSNIQMDVTNGDDYIQSATILNCFARGITGKFIDATDIYDLRVSNCLFEVVSGTIIYASGSITGGVFSHNLVQSCSQLYVNCAYAYGVEVNGNYIESLKSRALKIDYAYGVNFSGNYVYTRGNDGTTNNQADLTFYEVYIGESFGFTGSANYFTHRGYQFEGISKIVSVGNGDYAGYLLIKDTTALKRNTYGATANNGRMALYTSTVAPTIDSTLTLQENNASGVGSSIKLNNGSTGSLTENLISFNHQTGNKVNLRSTVNVDGQGTGNLIIETKGSDGIVTQRIKINEFNMFISEALNFNFGTTTGTKIGTSASQKMAFYGKAPVVQPIAVADATNATDVITQLNSLLAKLRTLGIIAP
jgi:hypothetical protein